MKFEVIVGILGKQYKCKIEAEDQESAWLKARSLMCDKITYISADEVNEDCIQEMTDFDNIFNTLFNKFKSGQR